MIGAYAKLRQYKSGNATKVRKMSIQEMNEIPIRELEEYCTLNNIGICVKHGLIQGIFVNRW